MTLLAVFQWVLYSTVAGSVAAALVLLVKALSRNRFTATWHYLIWFIVLFRLVVPYSFGNTGIIAGADSLMKVVGLAEHSALNALFPGKTDGVPVDRPDGLPGTSAENSQGRDPGVTAPPLPPSTADPSAPAAPTAGAASPFDLATLAIIWLAGAIVTGTSILVSYRRLMVKVAREPRCTDPELLATVDSARAELGIRTAIPVILDSTVNSPSFVGLFKPRLLMPAQLPENLSAEAKRHIVMHELAHLKRHDILVNWLTVALQTLHWFNPLIWHAFSLMKQDCEVACDATALAHIEPNERRGYGQTIIDLLQLLSRPVVLPGTTHIASKQGIKRRMAMIAKSSKKRNRWTVAAIIVTVAIVAGALVGSGARAWALSRNKANTPPVADQTAQNPITNTPPTTVYPNPSTSGNTASTTTSYTKSYIASKLAAEKNAYDVTWSPDNSMVVFIKDGGQSLPTGYVWKVGAAEAKSLGQVSDVTYGFIWAPDSKHFLISERVGGPRALVTVVNASDLSRNPVQINSVTQPVWGPDSKSIAAGCEVIDQQGVTWTTLQVFTIGQKDSMTLVKVREAGIPITVNKWAGSTITYTIDDGNGSPVQKTVNAQ